MGKNIKPNNSSTIDEKNYVSKQVQRNKDTLEMINSWIVAADSKVSVFCGVFSAVFAVMVFVAENFLSKRTMLENIDPFWKNTAVILTGITVLSFLASLFFSFLAVSPKLPKIENRKGKYSLFYVEIAKIEDSQTYVTCAKKATDEMYNEELLNEIYINSGVCTRKMRQFRWSLWLSFVSIIAAIIAGLIFIFITS